jgi:hypothetical protein
MKHRDQLTNRIVMKLALPVDGSSVHQRLGQHSCEPIPIPQLRPLQSKDPISTFSHACARCSIPAHGATSKVNKHVSIPIGPAAVERFSPTHF